MSKRRRATVGVLVACVLALTFGPSASVALAAEPTPQPGASRPAPTMILQIDTMSPRVVTNRGPATLTVAGRLINTGERAVDALEVRVQRSNALRGEGEVRAALAGDLPTDAAVTDFVGLPGPLAPGAVREIRLQLPLPGPPPTGLSIAEPGTYELLINVNGTREGDVRARLAAARTLLPVLGLPPEPGATPGAATTPGPDEPPTTARTNPLPVGLLYPIADQPRRLPTGPDEPVLLTDDELAASLEPTGRLGGLVTALREAPAGSDVRAATCLAVDPALLQTVAAMAAGYRVRTPDGAVAEGRGAAAAGRWIEELRVAARGGCVIALPYADADLVALSRGGLADLSGYAVQHGAQVATTILDTPVVTAGTWPAEGVLDELSLTDYLGAGGRSLVLSAEAVSLGRSDRAVGPAEVVRLPVASGQQAHALLTDPLLTLAADPGGRPGEAGETAAGPGGQDVVGALAFRATNPEGAADRSEPVLLAPPHLWQNTTEGAVGLLATMRELLGERQVATRNVAGLLTNPPPASAPAGRLLYSGRAGAAEVPPSVIRELLPVRDDVADLRAAAEHTPGVGRSPAEVFDPVTDAMVVAASAAWRNWPDRAVAAQQAVAGWAETLRNSVRVVEPPAPYTLAGEQAPLLLTVANGLPVAMNVRVELTATSGLQIEPVPVQRIPPQGRIQLRVNAEVSRSGQFPVYARVLTPSGAELGPPSRLLVSSSAYGTIAVWLTVVAGVLLVVLAGRQILRRIRREAARRRTAGRPTPRPPPDPSPTTPATPATPASPSDRPSETARTPP